MPLLKASIVEIKRVSKSLQRNAALNNVSLNINSGDFIALIGPNGAGKTTLLNIIDGLIVPDKGDIRVFGGSPDISGIVHQKRIGYIFQDEHVEKKVPLSVMDVVSVGRMGMRGIFRRLNKLDKYAIETAMKEVGIYKLKDRPAGFLSGGEQRKVSIAREISREVDIILLDEILMNLDPVSQMEINNLISKIYRKYGLTIIFVTHLLHYLPDGINRVIALKDGKVFWEGGTEGLNITILTDLYGCSKEALERYVGTFKI